MPEGWQWYLTCGIVIGLAIGIVLTIGYWGDWNIWAIVIGVVIAVLLVAALALWFLDNLFDSR